MILTQAQAAQAGSAVTTAVSAFATVMDVDPNAASNALFGALLAEFVQANGPATRAELDKLVSFIEDRMPAANELAAGAAEVEVAE